MTRLTADGPMAESLGYPEFVNLAAGSGPPLWVAGVDPRTASIIDLQRVVDPARSVLVDPCPLPVPLVRAARADLVAGFVRYREVLLDGSNPLQRLQILTNDRRAVDVLAEAVARAGLARRAVVRVVGSG